MSTLGVLSVRCRVEKKTSCEEETVGLIQASKEDLINHYEELRLQALGQAGMNRGLGFALLRQQGMRCWIESWSKCLPPPRIRESSTGYCVPFELHSEIANILAGIALSSRRWEVNP
jgi:hypothetical protein